MVGSVEQQHGGRIYSIMGKCVRRVDDGMSHKYCPGFMCVGRKPHPFGNECHTIRCALTSILFRSLIVEVKDRPRELGQLKYTKLGRTVGLILWMCETPYSTRKVAVMDSGFCLSRGIVELKRKVLYGASLIKKKYY